MENITMFDKEKFDRLQILLPKEYTPKLKILAGRIKLSPFVSELIMKVIDEEEKKNPDKFR
jgi:hypothetical protein